MSVLAFRVPIIMCICFATSSAKAEAECGSVPKDNDPARPASLGSEVALANMIIYSQEYMRYFFADNDSDVRPLPASGVALFTSYGLSPRTRLLNTLTLPLKEEEVKKKDRDTYTYYYPKILMTGYEVDFLKERFMGTQSCIRVSGSAGLAFLFGPRMLRYFPPFLLTRASVGIAPQVDLNFGIGYSGRISTGAWFFPFGVSYRL